MKTGTCESRNSSAAAWLWVAAQFFVASGILAQPGFTDVTSSAGLTYIQQVAQVPPSCMFGSGSACEPERMSGGAAVGDVDGDGDLDLYVTRLDAPDLLFLYNHLTGQFQDGAAAAGLTGNFHSNGAAFADIDNDGDQDLYVVTMGDANDAPNNRNYLFINNGSGSFTEVAEARGAAVITTAWHRSFSIAFGDYDRDGRVDIHTTEWRPLAARHSRLLHGLSTGLPGFFEDTTVAAGVDAFLVDSFASTFTDLDGDGWPDLAVAADFHRSRLFWNNGDGTFRDGTTAAGVGSDENGMGSTLGDFDGDGDLDWFVTSIYDADATCDVVGCGWGYTGNRLYRNEGRRLFSDATDDAGVRNGYWGWGTVFFDYDNDGDLDLVMTNGVDFPVSSAEDKYNTDPMRFWENDGTGVMTERSVEVGLTDTGSGKGLLVFDYNNDGRLDLFVVNNCAEPRLYRNDVGNLNDWLRVRLVGTASTRDGWGARVEVKVTPGAPMQVREIGTASHFLGQSERTAHFGLGFGIAPVALVRVRWPNGQIQEFNDVQRNTTLLVNQPACAGELIGCPGTGTAGSVPDGWWSTPGPPLTVEQIAGGDLTLSWGGSCDPSDGDYNVYEGALGDFTSHAPKSCGTGGATTWTVSPNAGNTYYLVTPVDGAVEGSYGRTGGDAERPLGATSCLPQAVGTCQ